MQKPWREVAIVGGSQLWWDVYDRVHPEQLAAWRRQLHALEDWSFNRVVSVLTG